MADQSMRDEIGSSAERGTGVYVTGGNAGRIFGPAHLTGRTDISPAIRYAEVSEESESADPGYAVRACHHRGNQTDRARQHGGYRCAPE